MELIFKIKGKENKFLNGNENGAQPQSSFFSTSTMNYDFGCNEHVLIRLIILIKA